jgi:hypothetical protein
MAFFSCQRPPSRTHSRPEVNIRLYHLFAFVSSKNGLLLNGKFHYLRGGAGIYAFFRTMLTAYRHGVEQAFMPAVRRLGNLPSARSRPARSKAERPKERAAEADLRCARACGAKKGIPLPRTPRQPLRWRVSPLSRNCEGVTPRARLDLEKSAKYFYRLVD